MEQVLLKNLNKEIEIIFSELFSEYSDDVRFIFKKCSDLIKRPSKRIRPLLFFYTLLDLNIKIEEEHIRIGAIIELLHSFALIHDDIVDNSQKRRGGKAFHIDIKKIFVQKNDKIGIISGDTLFSACFLLLSGLNIDNDIKINIISIFSEICFKTCIGELKDITLNSENKTSQEQIFKYYDLKTGIYSFILPVKIAFVIAQKESKLNITLENSLLWIGRYFQIKNDIKDIENAEYLDFFNKNNTYLNSIIFSEDQIDDINKMIQIIKKQDVDEMLKLFKKYDVLNKADIFCKKIKEDAIKCIKNQKFYQNNLIKLLQKI